MNSFDRLINNIKIDYLRNKIRDRQIFIWGASTGGKKLYDILLMNDIQIDMIIDKNSEQCKLDFQEVQVENTKILENINKKPFILIAINYYKEVEEELNKYGYVDNIDYIYIIKPHQIMKSGSTRDIFGNEFEISCLKNLNMSFIGCNSKIVICENCNIEAKIEGYGGIIEIGNNTSFVGRIECSSNSKVIIKSNSNIDANIICGNNSNIILEEKCSFSGNTYIYCLYNSYVKIGSECMFGYNAFITCNFNGCIEFGDDCLISTNVSIICGDGHPIIDCDTKKLINNNQTIFIGNHVWIGTKVSVLGGSFIDYESVIGANSLVKNKFTNNCIVAGCPAKLVRNNITWERDLSDFHQMMNS